jgi:hypothetical protein
LFPRNDFRVFLAISYAIAKGVINPFDRHRSLWSGKVVETGRERFRELTEEQMCAERANEAGP